MNHINMNLGSEKLSPPVSLLVHEIKNPLCNIYLACDALSLSDLDETQRICVEIISRGSARINNLTDIILYAPGDRESETC